MRAEMKFPYGIADFHKLITEGYFYADRTDRIAALEQAGDHLLFLRPRRFGKSLVLSMLENYYDLAKTNEFEGLFGRLGIGRNPTPKHNRYFVMWWDFSMVVSHGDAQAIKRALHNHINACARSFISRYHAHLPQSIRLESDDALVSFQSVVDAVGQPPYKLYLFIDEYDNFANEVLAARIKGRDRYRTLVHGEGILKTVFKAIKSLSCFPIRWYKRSRSASRCAASRSEARLKLSGNPLRACFFHVLILTRMYLELHWQLLDRLPTLQRLSASRQDPNGVFLARTAVFSGMIDNG